MDASITINEKTDLPALNIALDTIEKGKQALVFCNTKRTAESTAEKLSYQVKKAEPIYSRLAEKALKVLSNPTKQCKRLALVLKKGIAFHHAGLPSGQRKLIEENFRLGHIKVICSTPTLAFGLNLPAFRAIMKDLKRYGGRWGMQWIPTLEYHQCIGRAGRPDFNDTFGEAIAIAKSEAEEEEILTRYVNGDPEEIYSKLAVEPVLRTYVLSLIASDFVNSEDTLLEFFSKTFYAHQYDDLKEIQSIILRILDKLEEWEFINATRLNSSSDFISANEITERKLKATRLGKRVSELYIDPYTAHFIITALRRATQLSINELSFIHMASNTLELKPYFRVRTKEVEGVEGFINEQQSWFIVLEPSFYEPAYDEYLNATKTAMVLYDWINENDEEYILETYNVRPGEFNYKKDNADWILYAAEEIASILQFRDSVKMIRKARYRLKHGIKEELMPLVRVKGIGRIRARKLYRNGIKNIGDLKRADIVKLAQLIGKKTSQNIKKELGQEVKEIPKRKRKGQLGLSKY